MPDRLFRAAAEPADLIIRGARLVDPNSGIDGQLLDVRVRDGVIAELGAPGLDGGGAEEIAAEGLTMLPGLIDPHVHLRTPGDED